LKEDAMSSTSTTTCPLCGLGYPNRALLELHVREDHPRHRQTAAELPHDARSRTGNEVITMAAAQKPRSPHSPAVLEASGRGIRTRGKLGHWMAARFSLMRPRHPLSARDPPADHDAQPSGPEHEDRAAAAR